MVAQELHPFPLEPDVPAPAGSPPPRRSRLLPTAALAIGVLLGGVGGGAAVTALLSHPQTAASSPAVITPFAPTTTTGAAATGTTPTAEAVYAQDVPGVVTISTAVQGRFGRTGEGTGSGVVLDTQGNILTNAHVVAGAQQILVTFNDGTTATGTVVGSDSNSDLAIVRVSVAASRLHPLAIGNSDATQVGDRVYAIGAPFGLSGTLTEGIVSGLHRSNSGTNTANSNSNLIQIDAAINPGNSGGALLNAQGQLIGINESITSPINGNVGVGFAIPINQAMQQLSALEKGLSQ